MDVAATAELIRTDIRALPVRTTAPLREVRKAWSKQLKAESAADVIAVAQAIEREAGQGGKWIGYELIRFHKGAFDALGEAEIADFTGRALSWYAVDALGTVLTGPLWAKDRLPDRLIAGWADADDRWLRRSALVATVKLGERQQDTARTLDVCRKLAADRDDMVEKAMSWALRSLAMRDRQATEAFMAEMDRELPARAVREVRNKLRTGLKSGRR